MKKRKRESFITMTVDSLIPKVMLESAMTASRKANMQMSPYFHFKLHAITHFKFFSKGVMQNNVRYSIILMMKSEAKEMSILIEINSM